MIYDKVYVIRNDDRTLLYDGGVQPLAHGGGVYLLQCHDDGGLHVFPRSLHDIPHLHNNLLRYIQAHNWLRQCNHPYKIIISIVAFISW